MTEHDIPRTLTVVALGFLPSTGLGQIVTKFHTCEDAQEAVSRARDAQRMGSHQPWAVQQLKVGDLPGGRVLIYPAMLEHLVCIVEQEVPNPEHPDVKAEQMAKQRMAQMMQGVPGMGQQLPAGAFPGR